ncbi:pilus assembly protein [Tepidimonas ignava]|uniref:pilus assembly protein n=1 Tax=Tepidimonas ignava TaxID=114249 RepID=UPI00391A5908
MVGELTMKHRTKSWIALIFATMTPVAAHAEPWPSVPLFVGLNVPPTVVLAVDDSGSMDSEILLPTNDGALWWNTSDKSFVGRDTNDTMVPGTLNYNNVGTANDTWKKYVYLFPNGTGTGNRLYGDATHDHYAVPPLPQFAFLRSPTYNNQYYDPTYTYLPWPSSYGSLFANANPANAPSDPTRGGNALNLTGNINVNTDNWKFRTQNGMKYRDGSVVKEYTTSASTTFNYFPATYYLPTQPTPTTLYNEGKSNCANPKADDYKAFEANPALPLPAGVDAIGPDGRCLTRYEIKPGNTFPSGRSYADEIQNFANWFTYYRKRHLAMRGGILRAFENVRGFTLGTFPFNNRTNINFYTYPGTISSGTPSGKNQLFTDIKDYVSSGGTPTREALNHIGTQLQRTTNSPLTHVCQKNYGIVFTDGFANASTITGIGNEDGSAGTPYADSYSGTLADIAMKYYKQLKAGGNVPKEAGCGLPGAPAWLDCNTEWHLNTYAVTLGTKGTLFGKTHFTRNDAYNNPPVWPEPNLMRNPRMVDDLYHATINGRGEMLNANKATELQAALEKVINTILDLSASGAGAAVSSQRITADTRVFYTTFESGTWSGDVKAYPLSDDGVGSSPVWSAAQQLPAPSARNIMTRSGGNTVPFLWNNLSATDQTALVSANVVNYLRGDRSNEKQNGGTLRNRPTDNVLGDIAHSSPLYLKDNDTIFVGANDGMLHAYDASTGRELFAYIPSSVLPRLKTLSEPSYQHQYFVDGEIAASSRLDTGGKNYLVVALGRGGKGLFALDVTNPSTFSASNVLWEQFGTTDNSMGYILGQPVIAQMNSGDWVVIVGNGYASSTGTAALYIYRLSDGTLLKKLDTGVTGDNGVATPSVWDDNGDRKIDYIYAGDLRGNVWRMDVTSNNPNQWRFMDTQGNQPKPFFTAKDGAGNVQPITAPIGIAINNKAGTVGYGKRFLLFGTGSYFRTGDASDKSQQTWYGLIEQDLSIAGRSELVARTVDQQSFFDGKPVRTFSEATSNDMHNRKGWYLDFPGNTGERIVTRTIFVNNSVTPFAIASSIIPSENPCEPGGRGFLNFIDPFTGARLSSGVADINDNKDFSDDKLGGAYIGSVDVGVGLPTTPELTTSRVVVPGTTGLGSVRIRATERKLGRINWREIVRD